VAGPSRPPGLGLWQSIPGPCASGGRRQLLYATHAAHRADGPARRASARRHDRSRRPAAQGETAHNGALRLADRRRCLRLTGRRTSDGCHRSSRSRLRGGGPWNGARCALATACLSRSQPRSTWQFSFSTPKREQSATFIGRCPRTEQRVPLPRPAPRLRARRHATRVTWCGRRDQKLPGPSRPGGSGDQLIDDRRPPAARCRAFTPCTGRGARRRTLPLQRVECAGWYAGSCRLFASIGEERSRSSSAAADPGRTSPTLTCAKPLVTTSLILGVFGCSRRLILGSWSPARGGRALTHRRHALSARGDFSASIPPVRRCGSVLSLTMETRRRNLSPSPLLLRRVSRAQAGPSSSSHGVILRSDMTVIIRYPQSAAARLSVCDANQSVGSFVCGDVRSRVTKTAASLVFRSRSCRAQRRQCQTVEQSLGSRRGEPLTRGEHQLCQGR